MVQGEVVTEQFREVEPYKTIGKIRDPLLGQSLLRIPGIVHMFIQ